MKRVYSAFLSLGIFLSMGCAGPMSPFGAVHIFQKTAPESTTDIAAALPSKGGAQVHYSPDRQVLHGPSNFTVVIEDSEGVPDDFRLWVNYNGLDVTREFMSHAQVSNTDPLHHEVRLMTKFMRLLPTRENKVRVSYRRTVGARPVVAQYLPPTCSAFANAGTAMVFSIPDFEPPLVMLQLINQISLKKNLNPYFVAALVAQESGFDTQALSRNKALGLTQVTSLGESEIIKRYENWPRYPLLGEMPWPLLKLAILNGRINQGNEWRLDPALSIEGGAEYLSYLAEYWKRPERRAQIERKLGPGDTALSEVMLASYNSGASRVSEALERSGDHWLQDEELGEAGKYVRRVVSYCDHFANRED